MAKFVVVPGRSDDIFQAMHDSGVFPDDPRYIRRVVIDLEAGNIAKAYVERFVDDKLVDVVMAGGFKIVAADEGDPA